MDYNILINKNHNFEVLFEKLDDAERNGDNVSNYIDADLFRQVDSDIESLRGNIEAINESQCQTYSRS